MVQATDRERRAYEVHRQQQRLERLERLEEAQEDIGHYVANKIINYINTGTTYGSVNLPEIQLPELQSAHRIMHIHENVKGILAQINNILLEYDNNILGQYLKTNETLGYVITDIDNFHNKDLEKKLKKHYTLQ